MRMRPDQHSAHRRPQARGTGRRPARHAMRMAGWIVVAMLVLLGLPLRGSRAAGPAFTLGVVEFYAISPVGPIVGMIPERTAADDLSDMLARAAGDRFMVVPRGTMQQAEADLRWREDDVLHFARLSDLAARVHADRLVVGWIQQFSVGKDSSGGFPIPEGGEVTGFTSLVVQVFDAHQGRLVTEVKGTGDARGLVRTVVAEQVLRYALEPIVRSLLPRLTPAP